MSRRPKRARGCYDVESSSSSGEEVESSVIHVEQGQVPASKSTIRMDHLRTPVPSSEPHMFSNIIYPETNKIDPTKANSSTNLPINVSSLKTKELCAIPSCSKAVTVSTPYRCPPPPKELCTPCPKVIDSTHEDAADCSGMPGFVDLLVTSPLHETLSEMTLPSTKTKIDEALISLDVHHAVQDDDDDSSDLDSEKDMWENATAGSEDYWECSSDCSEIDYLGNSSVLGNPAVTSQDLLYSGSPITVEESLLSIMSFQQSEKLSGAGLAKLLSLIELHCPKPNSCVRSPFKLCNQLSSVKTPLKSFFYCGKCFKQRDSLTDMCDECTALSPKNDQVLVLSSIEQITSMYERPGFLNDIQYRFQRNKLDVDNIEDVYDGSVYKETGLNDILQKYNISLMWNTDGVCLYDSSSLQFWPLYFVILELPPEKRFKPENLILAAIYIGKSKPYPNVFLKDVFPHTELLKQGIKVSPPGFSEPLEVSAVLICGTCDSPAKAAMMNMKLYSGFYSCPKCLAKGEKSDRSDNVMVHPLEIDASLRTDENYEEDATIAMADYDLPKDRRVAPHGVKGPSYLYLMVTSMIISTSIDTMHCIYLGVMKQMMELWFNRKHRHEGFSLYNVKNVVNHLLVSVKPPSFVKRLPRSLEQIALFKAYEFMVLFYYYLLPILEGTMKQLFFHNFKLLVAGVALLNQKSVSIADITLAKCLLTQFVSDFEQLYGIRNMSFNVHLVLHLPSVVEALGPAYVTSCFRFEDLNGKLRSLIHGSRFPGSQLSKKLSVFLHLPRMVDDLNLGESRDYCKKIGPKWKKRKLVEKMFEKSFSVGDYDTLDYSTLSCTPEWLGNALGNLQYVTVFTFKRMTLNGILITSKNYKKSKANCSHFIAYTYGDIVYSGLVQTFIKVTMCSCTKNCLCPGTFFAVTTMFESDCTFATANPPVVINQH